MPSSKHYSEEVRLHIKALKDSDEGVRRNAVWALGKIGDAAAVPALIEALQDKDEEVRQYAAAALGEIGVVAIPALRRTLQEKDDRVRQHAVIALGEIGVAAIPTLIQTLQDSSAYVRRKAAEVLGEIGDVVAVPALLHALKDGNRSVRVCAVEALSWIGNTQTLPLKVLSTSHLTLPQKRDTLEAMSHVDFREKSIRVSYRYLSPVHAYCQNLLARMDVDTTTKEAAKAVLQAITLVRSSDRDTTTDNDELLHPLSGSPSSTPPDHLLRTADAPNAYGSEKSLFQRWFRRK